MDDIAAGRPLRLVVGISGASGVMYGVRLLEALNRLGALDGAYAAAGVCLTGGSLVDHGGHTPWEPAAHACALLHGPHVANFAADYAALDAQGAAREVANLGRDSVQRRRGGARPGGERETAHLGGECIELHG